MKLRFERTYPFPVDAVWHALTDARAIRQWWVDTDFEPVEGREFFFRDKPQRGWDGMVRGRVLEARPPHRVRFTWVGSAIDSTVTYDLVETGQGTTLTLTHEGLDGLKGLLIGTMLRFGWRGFVRQDVPRLAGHIAAHGLSTPFPTPAKAARVSA
jgi:uncharacterized protein YndB with AHSA1/START domain